MKQCRLTRPSKMPSSAANWAGTSMALCPAVDAAPCQATCHTGARLLGALAPVWQRHNSFTTFKVAPCRQQAEVAAPNVTLRMLTCRRGLGELQRERQLRAVDQTVDKRRRQRDPATLLAGCADNELGHPARNASSILNRLSVVNFEPLNTDVDAMKLSVRLALAHSVETRTTVKVRTTPTWKSCPSQ